MINMFAAGFAAAAVLSDWSHGETNGMTLFLAFLVPCNIGLAFI